MRDFQLDENDNMPLWAQLKKRLTYLIMTREYSFGDQMPTVRELSSKLGIAYNTVSKVYRDLERDGFIRTKQGSGTFVTYKPAEGNDHPNVAIEAATAQLVDQAKEFGMTDEEIISLVEKYLRRNNS